MRLTRDEQDMKDERDYREDVQRQVDDAAEAKRAAYGMSPEQLALMDTYAEGARAGTSGAAAGANPWRDPGSPEYQAWFRGWRAGTLNRRAA